MKVISFIVKTSDLSNPKKSTVSNLEEHLEEGQSVASINGISTVQLNRLNVLVSVSVTLAAE